MLTDDRFGQAATLYRKAVHPRLLLDRDGIEELKERAGSSNGRAILRAMRRQVSPAVRVAGEVGDLRNLFSSKDEKARQAGALLHTHVFDLALLGLLQEDDRALDAAVRTVDAAPELIRALPEKMERGGPNRALFLAYDILYDRLDPGAAAELRREVLERIIEWYGPRIEREMFVAPGMNMPIGRCLHVAFPALAFQGDPGMPDLRPRIETCSRFLRGFCRTALGPNGYPEEDIGYGTSCVSSVTELGELLFRSGHFNLFRHPGWRRFGQALLHFVQPWGHSLTVTGDFGHLPSLSSMLLARMTHETGDRSLLWVYRQLDLGSQSPQVRLSNGLRVMAGYSSLLYLNVLEGRFPQPGEAGVPMQFCDRGRGIVSVRSSWGPEATYAHFDSSQRRPSVMGHWHCSAGHFSLSALGEYFSIDTGRYNIDRDQHSVMLVDGQSPYSTQGEWTATNVMGRILDFTPGDLLDTAVIDSSQMSDCFWSFRTLGLVKGDEVTPYLWTVDDVNKANDFREFWWTLQTHPSNRVGVRGERAWIHGHRHGNRLDIGFAYPGPEEYPKPHRLKLEWGEITTSSYKYETGDYRKKLRRRDPMAWSALWRPRLMAKLSGYNGKLMAVMVPVRKGRAQVRIERLASVPNSLAMKVYFARVTDTLIYAYEHGFLEAEDIAGEGDFALVRRRRRDGAVLAWAMRKGVALKVGKERFTVQ